MQTPWYAILDEVWCRASDTGRIRSLRIAWKRCLFLHQRKTRLIEQTAPSRISQEVSMDSIAMRARRGLQHCEGIGIQRSARLFFCHPCHGIY